ncbi:hypothetical protein [Tunturiibacter gelidiferens]|uniref:hypothetical protein n=1 Tax=Tunturiibacter gelidiferens TaxID=3069689 RepID=UPI003D9B3B7D
MEPLCLGRFNFTLPEHRFAGKMGRRTQLLFGRLPYTTQSVRVKWFGIVAAIWHEVWNKLQNSHVLEKVDPIPNLLTSEG